MAPRAENIGDSELVDDFHPIACSLIGGVGSIVLKNEFKSIFREQVTSDHFDIDHFETDTDPGDYKLVGSEQTAWEPDLVKTYRIKGYDGNQDDEITNTEWHEIHIPLAIRARLSDVPELEEIEAVSDEDIETMKIFSENHESTYPGIVTVCLDDLPGQFKVVEFTLV